MPSTGFQPCSWDSEQIIGTNQGRTVIHGLTIQKAERQHWTAKTQARLRFSISWSCPTAARPTLKAAQLTAARIGATTSNKRASTPSTCPVVITLKAEYPTIARIRAKPIATRTMLIHVMEITPILRKSPLLQRAKAQRSQKLHWFRAQLERDASPALHSEEREHAARQQQHRSVCAWVLPEYQPPSSAVAHPL